jgi:hypothetical protein
MLTQPTKWKPGTVYDYSNFGYCVLGAVIAKVTNQSYASWVTANVLQPAGAGGIVQGSTLWGADHEVVYYNSGQGQDVFDPTLNAYSDPYGHFYLEAMAAHGAWVASPVDLLRFQGAIDGRTGVPALLDSKRLTDLTANPHVLSATVDSTTDTLGTVNNMNSWYGMGWLVYSNGNWAHTGSLEGSATVQVHTKDGWGFVAEFNSEPGTAFDNELGNAVWSALNGVTSWQTTTSNLFDQYGAYTAWGDSPTYQAEYDQAVAAGKYPSRVEGYDSTGTPVYRASFVPFHGTAWTSHNGMDCPTYQSYASSLATQGYETASLQSFVASDGTRRYQATWVKP